MRFAFFFFSFRRHHISTKRKEPISFTVISIPPEPRGARAGRNKTQGRAGDRTKPRDGTQVDPIMLQCFLEYTKYLAPPAAKVMHAFSPVLGTEARSLAVIAVVRPDLAILNLAPAQKGLGTPRGCVRIKAPHSLGNVDRIMRQRPADVRARFENI